jgi:glycosyltransferase involved in cell wall biosynthesis
VVATPVAGNPLAVIPGVTGLIVPEQEPAALAAAVAALLGDPALRRQMGAAARRRIEDELGWPQLARRYRTQFARLLAAG